MAEDTLASRETTPPFESRGPATHYDVLSDLADHLRGLQLQALIAGGEWPRIDCDRAKSVLESLHFMCDFTCVVEAYVKATPGASIDEKWVAETLRFGFDVYDLESLAKQIIESPVFVGGLALRVIVANALTHVEGMMQWQTNELARLCKQAA